MQHESRSLSANGKIPEKCLEMESPAYKREKACSCVCGFNVFLTGSRFLFGMEREAGPRR